jgi:hypothetical protein
MALLLGLPRTLSKNRFHCSSEAIIHSGGNPLRLLGEDRRADPFLQRQDLLKQRGNAPIAHDGCPLRLEIGKLRGRSLWKALSQGAKTELLLPLSPRFCLWA